jgi:hypothetical protein
VNAIAAQAIELRILTHQPEQMVTWWAALLGSTPRSLGSRATIVTTGALQVVIETSHIALDYHPEASGVTAISLIVGDAPTARHALRRVAELNCQPYRVTQVAGVMRFWLRDPNGTDVAVCLPSPTVGADLEADARPEELEVRTALSDLGHEARRS